MSTKVVITIGLSLLWLLGLFSIGALTVLLLGQLQFGPYSQWDTLWDGLVVLVGLAAIAMLSGLLLRLLVKTVWCSNDEGR